MQNTAPGKPSRPSSIASANRSIAATNKLLKNKYSRKKPEDGLDMQDLSLLMNQTYESDDEETTCARTTFYLPQRL